MSEEKKIDEMNVELSEEEMKEGTGGASGFVPPKPILPGQPIQGGGRVIMNPVILPGGGIGGR
jgi:hypothetical protein